MSLYAEYIKEREGKDILETNKGFLVYTINPPYFSIDEIFVSKEFRRSKEANRMADLVVEIAKEKGCTRMVCQADTNAKNWEDSVNYIIAYGCEFHSSSESLLFFTKSIKD